MEQNMLQKVDAFRYLYKEHRKEITTTIQKSDEEMEASLNYREKLWTKSLHMVNANMITMYNAQGEFECDLNSIRGRQTELIKTTSMMLEWMTNQLLGDRTTERP